MAPLRVMVLKVLALVLIIPVFTHGLVTQAEKQTSAVSTKVSADHLQLREDSSTSNPSRSSNAAATNSKGTVAQASSSSMTSSTPSPLPIPSPFDSILGENFTQPSCPTFFNNFIIRNETFKSCAPFSLLLQNSKAFFQAGMSSDTLNPILDASCAAPFAACSALMSNLASMIMSNSWCANDFALRNPLVVQAYNGLVSYAPMFNASCLRADPSGRSSGSNFPYCYTSSLNSTSQADSQMYFLPVGAELPTGSSVSCSACTQRTMAIFADAAHNSTNPLNRDYLPAANIINTACGGDFVNASSAVLKAPAASKTNVGHLGSSPSFLSLFVGAMSAIAALIFI